MATRSKIRSAALKHGWRSGLEEVVSEALTAAGVRFKYEPVALEYEQPATKRKYTPDFWLLDNGIIVETKGRFVTEDRKKHLLVRASHPDLDIRFLFSNARARIGKKSNTTYAMWCDAKGFKWAHRTIPDEWLHEAPNPKSLAAVRKLLKGK